MMFDLRTCLRRFVLGAVPSLRYGRLRAGVHPCGLSDGGPTHYHGPNVARARARSDRERTCASRRRSIPQGSKQRRGRSPGWGERTNDDLTFPILYINIHRLMHSLSTSAPETKNARGLPRALSAAVLRGEV